MQYWKDVDFAEFILTKPIEANCPKLTKIDNIDNIEQRKAFFTTKDLRMVTITFLARQYLLVGMILSFAGGMGIGLVWGWLIGSLEGHIRNPRQTIPVVILTSFIVSLEVFWFLDWSVTVLFWISLLSALTIHLFWRERLRKIFGLCAVEHQEANV